MPYSKAHWYLLGLLIITFLAFWNSYFGMLHDAPLAHHLHGITATLWILLLAAQNWSIHQKRVSLHRKMGKVLFVLVPLMTAAFAMVTWQGAIKVVNQHPFYLLFGQALLTADVLLLFTTAIQIYLALRLRRQVRLHSALMLGTLIGLLPPILSRLFANYLPGMTIEGPDTLYRFGHCLHLSILVSIAIAMVIFFCYRKQGWPWLLAAAITGMMYALYATVGQTDWWQQMVHLLATVHPAVVFGFGFAIGLLASFLGWAAGNQGHKTQPQPRP